MNHEFCAKNERIWIRPLKASDIENLRTWRNDKSLSMFLRDIPYITSEQQKQWYEEYLLDKDTLFFAVVDKMLDRMVGSIALYGFHGNRCEVGKIVVGDPSARGKGIGYGSLLLAMVVAFQELNLETVSLDVHEDNGPARSIYEKAGFTVIGQHDFIKGGHEFRMKISAEDFYQANPIAREINVYKESE